MAGRGVKHSRRRCDYRCGGRHAHACAVVCPCPCPPLFVRARARCRSSVPFPTVLAYPFVLVSAGPRLSPLSCTGWPSCLSLLVHALRRSFVLVFVRLLVSVCPHLFVSTWLCLSPLSGHARLAFARACPGLFVLGACPHRLVALV
jgi:hypothetical protein